MKDRVILQAGSEHRLRLRSAELEDAERLRVWKNANRSAFFFKEEISAEAQVKWMEEYQQRPGDYLFVVEWERELVGCMGIRLLEGKIDVYNVILGIPEAGGKGVMSAALRVMLRFARSLGAEIGLKVLKDNAAVRFYERNGFVVTAEHADHLEMVLNWQQCFRVEAEGA